MSEMIERVARAIAESDSSIPYSAARAAIVAMREPTEAMILASRTHHGQNYITKEQWRGMIDMALEGAK